MLGSNVDSLAKETIKGMDIVCYMFSFICSFINDGYVSIRDYSKGTYWTSRMAAVGESGQSSSIKSDTVCRIESQLLQFII
ncbi:MAG: hypothetical protein DRQ59_04885 [Gammaproteobacteria bacterium]|nr:MAG: hypothetical protein DRQ59_04885 [Gammaproteobacteria bacterium]